MKRILFLLLIPTFLTVNGQETKKQKGLNKTLIGFNFSPDYNFRTLKNNDGTSSSDLVIKSRNSIEVAKFGYTTGLNIWFSFSEQFGLETGIQYSNKGYKTNSYDLIFLPPDPTLPIKARATYSYQYIGVPLRARFTVGKSDVRFVSSVGFMTNLLLEAKQTNIFEYASGKTDKSKESMTADFEKVDISPMISLGIDYKLNDKTAW